MDARSDLEAWLDGNGGPPALDTAEPAPPPDAPRDVERWLRKLAVVTADAAEVDRLADEEIARYEAWRADRHHGLGRAAAWLERGLEGWMRANREQGGPPTFDLTSGVLRLRASRRAVDLAPPPGTDPYSALEALRIAHPTFVRVKLSLNRHAVQACTIPGPDGQAVLPATGELVPYVVFSPETPPGFTVELRR